MGGICTDGTFLRSYRRALAIWRIPFQLPSTGEATSPQDGPTKAMSSMAQPI